MTRTYAARRLLQHGPLTLREMVEVTGWNFSEAKKTLDQLLDTHLAERVTVRGVRRYLYRLTVVGAAQ